MNASLIIHTHIGQNYGPVYVTALGAEDIILFSFIDFSGDFAYLLFDIDESDMLSTFVFGDVEMTATEYAAMHSTILDTLDRL